MTETLPVLDPQRLERDDATVERGFWRKIAAVAARIPFADEALSAYFAARDPATPTRVRAVLLGALAYFVMPADLVPDFIAGLGFTDDATVLLLAAQTVSGHIKEPHRDKAKEALAKLRR
ncbi:MAG: YkvA family protein [Reyranellaceae bacterium]